MFDAIQECVVFYENRAYTADMMLYVKQAREELAAMKELVAVMQSFPIPPKETTPDQLRSWDLTKEEWNTLRMAIVAIEGIRK